MEELCALGLDVDRSFISRIFQNWLWSWKKPTHLQVQKFTLENIAYYFVWILTIFDMPWLHLKFLDESHFSTRSLRRSLVAGPVGQRVGLVDHSEAQESLSLTLLIDLAFPFLLAHKVKLTQRKTTWTSS